MKRIVAAILFSTIASTNAFAAWEIVATSPDGALHAYIDKTRIKKKNGVAEYWQKQDKAEGGTVTVKAEINCKTHQRREHDYYEHDSNGTLVRSFSDTTTWDEIIPETVNDLIYNEVCN